MMTTQKLSDEFGIAVEGLDLSQPLPDDTFARLEQTFFDGQVMAIRNQRLEAAAFSAFARRFGPPEPHIIDQFHYPGFPEILILSNGKEDGKPIGLQDGGSYFHTDYSYLETPARATILYSVVVPKVGGNTKFANMYAAYDDLGDRMKQRIDDLTVMHHYGNRDNLDETTRTVASPLTDAQKDKVQWVRHKLVREHPRTGRKALYAVSGSSFEIEGMTREEGVALLDELKEHALQDRYVYSHAYQAGDVVMWDDLSTLHSATLTDPDDLRTLWRITVLED